MRSRIFPVEGVEFFEPAANQDSSHRKLHTSPVSSIAVSQERHPANGYSRSPLMAAAAARKGSTMTDPIIGDYVSQCLICGAETASPALSFCDECSYPEWKEDYPDEEEYNRTHFAPFPSEDDTDVPF